MCLKTQLENVMTKTRSTLYRHLLNVTIRFLNRRLQGDDQIQDVPSIPFCVSYHRLESLVWEWEALYFEGKVDWRDNGNVRREEILEAKKLFLERHGAALKEYLAPYKGIKSGSYSESHRIRLAQELFKE